LEDFVVLGKDKKGNVSLKRYAGGYRNFVSHMDKWAEELGCRADEIEYFMYQNRGKNLEAKGVTVQMGNNNEELKVRLPSRKKEQLENLAREEFGLDASTIAQVWIIERLLQTNMVKPSLYKTTETRPQMPETHESLEHIRRKLGEQWISDRKEKFLFMQAKRFSHWANYIAGLVLTQKGKTLFTPKDIKKILRDELIPQHYGRSGAFENEVLTADVRVDAPNNCQFPSLERVDGRQHLYKFLGFEEGITRKHGKEILKQRLSNHEE
jgi:hypothetical protein